ETACLDMLGKGTTTAACRRGCQTDLVAISTLLLRVPVWNISRAYRDRQTTGHRGTENTVESSGRTAPDPTAVLAFRALHTPAGRSVLAAAAELVATDPLKAATRLRVDAERALATADGEPDGPGGDGGGSPGVSPADLAGAALTQARLR